MENYFSVSATLPSDYWNGIVREGNTNPFMYVTGQLVSSNVSGVSPALPCPAYCTCLLLWTRGGSAALCEGSSQPHHMHDI